MCGTDGVTYPNKCVLYTISPNVRIDYKGKIVEILIPQHLLICTYIGTCLEPQMKETVESYCKRVQKGSHCKIPTKCKKVIKPTDGCCPICGKLYIIVVYIRSYHKCYIIMLNHYFLELHKEEQSALPLMKMVWHSMLM